MRFTEGNTKKFKSQSLKEMRQSGSMVSPAQMQKLIKYFPSTRFQIGYGQAEVGGPVSRFSNRSGDLWKRKLNSCGLPAPNTMIKVCSVKLLCQIQRQARLYFLVFFVEISVVLFYREV